MCFALQIYSNLIQLKKKCTMEMYDEVVEVKNSREVDSPPDLDVRKSIGFVRQEDLGRITDEEEQVRFLFDCFFFKLIECIL